MNGIRIHTERSWSATAVERHMTLPGDDLVPSPLLQTTHAVTIGAPPAQVWPWLVQIGNGRAGFYAKSRLWDRGVNWHDRRLSRAQPGHGTDGCDIAAADRVVADRQHPRAGDIIADGPPGTAQYVVRAVVPDTAYILYTDTHLRYLLPARLRTNSRLGIFGRISYSFLLAEPEPGKTRLVRRMRMACGPWPFRAYFVPITLIWDEAITARRFLRGVKRRSEASARTTRGDQSCSFVEWLKTRIEHEVDTRSVRLAAILLRLTKGRIVRLWRRRALLLTTRGRRSGKDRTVPLQFFPDGDDMVVVAANSGLPSPPGWYFNLTASPVARVEVEGKVLQVRAVELSREQALAFWPRVLQIAPDYARYPKRTSRQIPLMRLVPITDR